MTKILIFILTFCPLILLSETIYFIEMDTLPKDDIILVDSLDVSNDSLSVRKKNFIGKLFNNEPRKPMKAVYMSLTVPGTGQIYNRKYWKLPIVYAGLGGLAYLVGRNSRNYYEMKKAYIYKLDEDNNTIDPYPSLAASAVKNIRDNYRKDMERSYIGLAAFYLFVVGDAFVDAHLATFNVDEDLTLKIKPSVENSPLGPQPAMGVSLVLGFK